MLNKKILVTLLLATSSLFATCENAIEYEVFLKEMSISEETIARQKTQIFLLEKEKDELSKKVDALEKALKEKKSTQTTKAEKFYKIAIDEANIYTRAKQESFSPYSLFRDERVQIGSCDNFGWCKLLNKNLYIKKLAIIPVN